MGRADFIRQERTQIGDIGRGGELGDRLRLPVVHREATLGDATPAVVRTAGDVPHLQREQRDPVIITPVQNTGHVTQGIGKSGVRNEYTTLDDLHDLSGAGYTGGS